MAGISVAPALVERTAWSAVRADQNWVVVSELGKCGRSHSGFESSMTERIIWARAPARTMGYGVGIVSRVLWNFGLLLWFLVGLAVTNSPLCESSGMEEQIHGYSKETSV